MDSFFKKMWMVVKNVLLLLLITSALIVLTALIFKFKISRVFLYVSIFYMAIGLGSVFGNLKAASGIAYFQAKSIAVKDMQESAREEFKLSNNSYRFLLYMEIVGIILMFTGFVFDAFGL